MFVFRCAKRRGRKRRGARRRSDCGKKWRRGDGQRKRRCTSKAALPCQPRRELERGVEGQAGRHTDTDTETQTQTQIQTHTETHARTHAHPREAFARERAAMKVAAEERRKTMPDLDLSWCVDPASSCPPPHHYEHHPFLKLYSFFFSPSNQSNPHCSFSISLTAACLRACSGPSALARCIHRYDDAWNVFDQIRNHDDAWPFHEPVTDQDVSAAHGPPFPSASKKPM